MINTTLDKKEAIRSIVHASVESFAVGFQGRHEGELEDPEGTLNMKIHNVFIAVLGPEIQYYTALVRSLDSSLGNMLEKMAINIAKLSYEVRQNVEGPLSLKQTQDMAELLEKYKRREITPPSAEDYQFLRVKPAKQSLVTKRHDSDYYLIDKDFWDFVCKSNDGYNIVLEAYKESFIKYFGDINSYKISWNNVLMPLSNNYGVSNMEMMLQ